MTDDPAATPSTPLCPWCSAELPPEPAETCRWCGATLTGAPEASVPGVTAIDAEAIVRAARTAEPQRRSRLLTWITGEDEADDGAPAPPGSLEPPPPDVRREMLRMQLAAEVADLQAEVGAMVAEARDAGLLDDEEPPPHDEDEAVLATEPPEVATGVTAGPDGGPRGDDVPPPVPTPTDPEAPKAD